MPRITSRNRRRALVAAVALVLALLAYPRSRFQEWASPVPELETR